MKKHYGSIAQMCDAYQALLSSDRSSSILKKGNPMTKHECRQMLLVLIAKRLTFKLHREAGLYYLDIDYAAQRKVKQSLGENLRMPSSNWSMTSPW